MDRTEALARLADLTGADQRPVLSEDHLGRILDDARTPDGWGRTVDDPHWVPTWDLNRAAAQGWRDKAAKVAGDFTFSADGAKFDKGEVMAKMLAMAEHYDAQAAPSILTVVMDRAGAPYDSPRLIL